MTEKVLENTDVNPLRDGHAQRGGNIYITGDTHGDFSRIERFCDRIPTTRDDIMIILGDAGFNYYRGWRDEYWKKRMAKLPITIFSIHGNHEIRPANIPMYHTQEWHGGQVYVEDAYPNLLFGIDGEVYDLGGMQTIVIGGAYSVDKEYRLLRNFGWWPDEQPSAEVKAKVEHVLAERNWKIEAVLSHTVPLKYEPVEVFLSFIDQSKVDKSTEEWLDGIEERLDYGHWYAGHYHTEKDIDKLSILFEGIREWKPGAGNS